MALRSRPTPVGIRRPRLDRTPVCTFASTPARRGPVASAVSTRAYPPPRDGWRGCAVKHVGDPWSPNTSSLAVALEELDQRPVAQRLTPDADRAVEGEVSGRAFRGTQLPTTYAGLASSVFAANSASTSTCREIRP